MFWLFIGLLALFALLLVALWLEREKCPRCGCRRPVECHGEWDGQTDYHCRDCYLWWRRDYRKGTLS